MANGLTSAARYGGPEGTIVDDPNVPSAPSQVRGAGIDVDDSTPSFTPSYTPVVPTSADVAPADRNLAEENNWMKELEDYANQRLPGDVNAAQREKFIDDTARRMRSAIAVQRNANRQILIQDQENVNRILYDTQKYQGRGPTNDWEASQINPQWGTISQTALQHDPAMQKRITAAFESNAKIDVPPTLERQARYDQAKALIDRAMRGFAGVDKYEVLKTTDPATMDLPRAWRTDLHNSLVQLNHQRNIDNLAGVYMGWAQPMLNKAHILASDDARQLQFEGALTRELKNLQSTSKDPEAPLTREQVYQVTAQLLRKEVYSRGWFGSNIFEFEVPKGYMTPERIDKFQKKVGHMPSPQDIYTLYSMHKANVLAGTEQPATDDQGNVIDPYYVIESYGTGKK